MSNEEKISQLKELIRKYVRAEMSRPTTILEAQFSTRNREDALAKLVSALVNDHLSPA